MHTENLERNDADGRQGAMGPIGKRRSERRPTRRATTASLNLPPALLAAMREEVRRRYVDPNATAYSIDDLCSLYGIGRQLVYDEINAGRLVAHKIARRTLIRRVDAERWLDGAPTIKPASPADTVADNGHSSSG